MALHQLWFDGKSTLNVELMVCFIKNRIPLWNGMMKYGTGIGFYELIISSSLYLQVATSIQTIHRLPSSHFQISFNVPRHIMEDTQDMDSSAE